MQIIILYEHILKYAYIYEYIVACHLRLISDRFHLSLVITIISIHQETYGNIALSPQPNAGI